jgi:integrase
MHVFGSERALDIERDHLDTVCRRWRSVGPTWAAGRLTRTDGTVWTWPARDPARVRPLDGATCNRYIATLRRAFTLGRQKRGLVTALTFPTFAETTRGEYLTEAQCRAICAGWRARRGAAVKADVFRLAYLLGVRKGQLRATTKKHVLIVGRDWKLRWPGDDTKNGEAHEVALVGEAADIVRRAWARRLPDCDHLFHVDGQPLGGMRSELRRTCEALGIPYGRRTGIVFHDTRHSAVTNLVGAGVPETVAMTITGHADRNVFTRYNVRRDDVQAEALRRQHEYLRRMQAAARRTVASLAGHDSRARRQGRGR